MEVALGVFVAGINEVRGVAALASDAVQILGVVPESDSVVRTEPDIHRTDPLSELCSEAAFRATLESALAPGPRSR